MPLTAPLTAALNHHLRPRYSAGIYNLKMRLRYQEYSRCRGSHDGGITSAAFSADGTYLATGGMDGKVCLWDPESGKLLHHYKTDTPVLSLAWTDISKVALVCGLYNGSLALLEVTEVSTMALRVV